MKNTEHDLAGLSAHLLHKLEARNELAALDFTRSTHLVHSLGSARDRNRREWRSACAMRVNCSAPGCSEGAGLGILRPRNGERVTLWVAKHVRGQGLGESTDFPKRR